MRRSDRAGPLRPGEQIRWYYHRLSQGHAYVLAEVVAIHDDYVVVRDRDETYRLGREMRMARLNADGEWGPEEGDDASF